MTEQKFRDALKRQVGTTGLSSDRQYRVLAGMKGGESKVKVRGRMKFALVCVLMLLLVFGMSAAIAGDRMFLKWDGELENAGTPAYHPTTDAYRRMIALQAKVPCDIAYVWNLNAAENETQGIGGGMSIAVESLEEMQALVCNDGTLPWVTWLPEGYVLQQGRIHYECDFLGNHDVLGWETTEDGFVVARFNIPEEHRVVSSYTLWLENAAGEELRVNVRLQTATMGPLVEVSEDETVKKLEADGVREALLVKSADEAKLLTRRILTNTVRITSLFAFEREGSMQENLDFYNSLVTNVTYNGKTLTEAALLAIFGLTTQ